MAGSNFVNYFWDSTLHSRVAEIMLNFSAADKIRALKSRKWLDSESQPFIFS
jgi:hypothetical protein